MWREEKAHHTRPGLGVTLSGGGGEGVRSGGGFRGDLDPDLRMPLVAAVQTFIIAFQSSSIKSIPPLLLCGRRLKSGCLWTRG